MDFPIIFLVGTGLSRGAIFATFGLALVLIWRAARIANFAQGAMAIVSCYAAFAVTGATGNYWLGLVAAVITGALMGFVVERGVIRFLSAGAHLNAIIVTVGVVMMIQAALGMVFGAEFLPMALPFSRDPLSVGGIPIISPYSIFVMVVVVVLMAALALLFTRTSVGLSMRASAFDPEVSRLNGIRVARMSTLGWTLSAAVGGLAAMLVVPTELGLNPHATDLLFLYAFTVAIIGGLDSPVGVVVAGLFVGVLMTLITATFGSSVVPIAIVVILLVTLLLRPQGIFASRGARLA